MNQLITDYLKRVMEQDKKDGKKFEFEIIKRKESFVAMEKDSSKGYFELKKYEFLPQYSRDCLKMTFHMFMEDLFK